MANITKQDLLSGRFDRHLRPLRELVRDAGANPAHSLKWYVSGIPAADDGGPLRLVAMQVGGRLFSTKRCVREFLAAKRRASAISKARAAGTR